MVNGFTERLGWTLIHFTWQGIVVAGLLAIALGRAYRAPSEIRYRIALLAMATLAALPVTTFLYLTPRSAPVVESTGVMTYDPGGIQMATANPLAAWMPALVMVWMIGVGLGVVRLGGSLCHVERWRRRYAAAAPADLTRRVRDLAERMGIRRAVEVLISDRAESPIAWGVFRAVIILPTRLLTDLTPHQVETILLHELNHIRRHDYLVNLLQMTVETALFYHPAVWWVSRIVRQERENCCDDAVIRQLKDPMPYARALLQLEERRITLPQPTLSAKGSNLMNRIARILGAPPVPGRALPALSTLALVVTATVALGGTFQTPPKATVPVKPAAKSPVAKAPGEKVVVAKPRSQTASKATAKVVTVKGRASAVSVKCRKPGDPNAVYATTRPGAKAGHAIPVKVVPGRPASSQTERVAPAKPSKGPVFAAPTPRKGVKASAFQGTVITTGQPMSGKAMIAVATPAAGEPLVATAIAVPTSGAAPSLETVIGVPMKAAMAVNAADASDGFAATAIPAGQIRNVEFKAAGNLISIDVEQAPFTSVLRSVAKAARFSVIIEPGYYNNVNMVISDQPLDTFLFMLTRAGNATLRIDGGVYFVSPKSGAPGQPPAAVSAPK